MSDETIIVKGTARSSSAARRSKAATGQDVTAEELGGADVHACRSGVADHYAASDEHALAIVRSVVRNLHRRKEPPWDISEPEDLRSTRPSSTGSFPRTTGRRSTHER